MFHQPKYKASLIILLLFVNMVAMAQTPCLPVALKCENLVDPLGIDAANPRLSWRLQDERTGAKQTGYTIIVGTDAVAVSNGKGNMLQVTKANAAEQTFTYNGKPLQAFTKYYWTVTVLDKDKRSSKTITPASFETGMMDIKNWQGAWISDTRDIHKKAAPYFRSTFSEIGRAHV